MEVWHRNNADRGMAGTMFIVAIDTPHIMFTAAT